MKIKSITDKTIFIFFTAFMFFCCNNQNIPEDPDPDGTKLPEIYSGMSYNVTRTSANLQAFICPNGSNVIVYLSYCSADQNNWKVDTLKENLKGNNIVRAFFELNDLKYNTKYKYKFTAKNKNGEVVSAEDDFKTANFFIPEIKVVTAYEVTANSGVSTVVFLPASNDIVTTVKAECAAIPENIWRIVKPDEVYDTSDTVKLSIVLNNLVADTKYMVRWIVSNKGGNDTCQSKAFKTFGIADYDGNYYHTLNYWGRTWLAENFRGTHFANGDPIPNVTDGKAWSKLTSGAYCWYNNNAELGNVYGGLYNWWVANDSRELIKGYRTTSNVDFDTMCLGQSQITGIAMTEAGNIHWIKPKPNDYIGYMNVTGFTALPNGYRSGIAFNVYPAGYFSDLGYSANFWTNTASEKDGCGLIWKIDENALLYPMDYSKNFGMGIRLVKKRN